MIKLANVEWKKNEWELREGSKNIYWKKMKSKNEIMQQVHSVFKCAKYHNFLLIYTQSMFLYESVPLQHAVSKFDISFYKFYFTMSDNMAIIVEYFKLI